MTLTTYITKLSLADNWKGTTCQFLSHFKEKLHLWDSLVPDTDSIPEAVRVTFLPRAVQKNNDLRQIHVLDSVWRSKTGSTGKFTFEVYYDLLWNAAYQHNLSNAEGHKKRQALISQLQVISMFLILFGSTGKFTLEVYYDFLWNAAYQDNLSNAAGHKKRQALISQLQVRSMFSILFGSTGKVTLEVYYDFLWNAAYQDNLSNAAGHKKRQAFISQQVDSFDVSDPESCEEILLDQEEVDSSPY